MAGRGAPDAPIGWSDVRRAGELWRARYALNLTGLLGAPARRDTLPSMIVVAGWLRLDAADRHRYLEDCKPVIEAARAAPGCHDFYLVEDPLDPERIKVFEAWEDSESVERFRGSGPTEDQKGTILDARVEQHEIASTTLLT